MNLKQMITPAALVMALAFGTAGTASAQDRHDNRGHSQRAPRAQQAQPQQRAQQPQQRAQQQPQQRAQSAPRAERAVPRTFNAQPRAETRQFDNRGSVNRGSVNRGFTNRGFTNRGFENRGFANRGFRAPIVRGRAFAPRVIYPRAYRPGFSLGFGLYFGNPIPYRYAYPAYGYGYQGVAPAVAYGGISFALTPGDAAVYVDGNVVGSANSYNDAQPLSLVAGTHRVELSAPGYEPVAFDVNIVAGQLLPYQGALQPAY